MAISLFCFLHLTHQPSVHKDRECTIIVWRYTPSVCSAVIGERHPVYEIICAGNVGQSLSPPVISASQSANRRTWASVMFFVADSNALRPGWLRNASSASANASSDVVTLETTSGSVLLLSAFSYPNSSPIVTPKWSASLAIVVPLGIAPFDHLVTADLSTPILLATDDGVCPLALQSLINSS
jgi:hypothetical protein